MDVKLINISASSEGVSPMLRMLVYLEFGYSVEAPIFVAGRLLCNGKIISHLSEYYSDYESNLELSILTKAEKLVIYRNKQSYSQCVNLNAILSRREIAFIEAAREKDMEKAVRFSLELTVRYLELTDQPNPLSSASFVKIYTKKFCIHNIINQSDWIKDYVPQLEIAQFLLIELKLPIRQNGGEKWGELYDRLFIRLNEMEESNKIGDWKKTLITARQFSENLKFDANKFVVEKDFKEGLKQLFLNDQHSEEGFNEFYSIIFHFFNYLSKFIHDKSNKTGKQVQIPNPTKEDAYFAYTLALGLTNLIGSKVSITSE